MIKENIWRTDHCKIPILTWKELNISPELYWLVIESNFLAEGLPCSHVRLPCRSVYYKVSYIIVWNRRTDMTRHNTHA